MKRDNNNKKTTLFLVRDNFKERKSQGDFDNLVNDLWLSDRVLGSDHYSTLIKTNNHFLSFNSLHSLAPREDEGCHSVVAFYLKKRFVRGCCVFRVFQCFRPKRCACTSKAGMRALIGQTVARHIRFPRAYAAFRFHTAQQKRNYRIGKGKILILVLVSAPVLMLASRSLHSYAFGACACIFSENQSLGKSRNAFE